MQTKLFELSERWLNPRSTQLFIVMLFIASMLYLSYLVVYYTGGTAYAYLHLIYLPIVAAGFFFSVSGGVLVAIIASLLLGPMMPLDIDAQMVQPAESWITRSIFFVLIGAASGFGSSIYRAYLNGLRERLLTNSLIQLPNFLGLEETFNERKVVGQDMAVVLIDIRNLNEVEVAIGPKGVDSLLKALAQTLKKSLPQDVVVGLTQTSVFTLLVPIIPENRLILNDPRKLINSSYTIEDIPVYVEIFVGISSYPKDGENFSEVFRKARMAMNSAARQARNLARYDASVVDSSGENTVLLTALHQAIENDSLQIHYQPKVELKTGRVYGLEALARWKHPEKGEIEPSQFIPLTERTMLINPFTRWMLKRAFSDMARWEKAGIQLNLAVNFSLRNFHDNDLIIGVLELAELNKLNPTNIEIEITESAFSTNMAEVETKLQYLRDRGFKVSIDDFGTGHASQQYLFQLPVDGLKIDKIFVSELGRNAAAEAIVRSAVSLGHQLNLQIIAEGIETREQYDQLLNMGCDYGQGYLFSPALPFDELMQWLRSKNDKSNLVRERQERPQGLPTKNVDVEMIDLLS